MRTCVNPTCGRTIIHCSGFVIARDYIRADAGEIPREAVRELCGLCVFLFDPPDYRLEALLLFTQRPLNLLTNRSTT